MVTSEDWYGGLGDYACQYIHVQNRLVCALTEGRCVLTDISDLCFVSLCAKLLFRSGTMGGGGFPMLGDELTVCRRDGRLRSPGMNVRRAVALPLRAVLPASSERSMSDSSYGPSWSSPASVLMLAPLLREGPAWLLLRRPIEEGTMGCACALAYKPLSEAPLADEAGAFPCAERGAGSAVWL